MDEDFLRTGRRVGLDLLTRRSRMFRCVAFPLERKTFGLTSTLWKFSPVLLLTRKFGMLRFLRIRDYCLLFKFSLMTCSFPV